MMNYRSNIDVERFLKMECDKFEREIFAKLHKCELNLFYQIDKFKYDQKKFITALKKRRILFRDLEFSDTRASFRMIKPEEMSVEESYDKTLEFARNMYFVNQWHDEIEMQIKNDPVIQEAIKNNKQSYVKAKY